VRNKAGVAGKVLAGRKRFVSYGSTTADGLRALLLCGRPSAAPRVAAARGWLETQFRADHHPGRFPADGEHNRDAVSFYYCCSTARALSELRVEEVQTPAGKVRWAEALADALLERQKSDGAWANDLVPQREDDPLVATSLAALVLATCRNPPNARPK
jgi:hypothetical protein